MTHTRTALAALGIVGGLAPAGCGATPAADALNATSERTFVATSVAWVDGEDPIERVVLRIGDGRVSLRAGCNDVSSYGAEVDGDRLVGAGVTTTDRGCPEPESTQDAWLAELLDAGPTIALDGERIELTSAKAVLTATEQ